MHREPGYHINVAKMRPDTERSSWDKAHGSGHSHFFNVYLGEVYSEGIFELFTEKFPPSEGYSLSLMRITSSGYHVKDTHQRVGDHTVIKEEYR